ncbi:XK-related protein 6 [Chionoecetes opilio]|uniref:XK-related protein n=1 Tax=Chionoecetes opilio TaxID=41210 RepID=A0A8J4Y7C7_CHIOP|nr:XK-related protein 6 [Chionoecetes opilio]
MEQNGRILVGGSEDEVDYPPNDYIYLCRDVGFVVFGVVTLLLDWGLDMATAYNHWHHEDLAWFILTVVFMSVSSLVMMGVSLYWYIKDTANEAVLGEAAPRVSRCKWVVRLTLLLCQLGPLQRYYDTLRYGWKSRKYWKRGDTQKQRQYYTWMLYEDGDSVFLRMFECFMESAPQLVLQLYILTQISEAEDPSKYGKIWRYTISFGSVTSLVSLAWGVMAFARGTRFTALEKDNISLLGSFVIFLWHLFCLGARVSALVVFASVFRLMVVWVCLGHWLLMVVCLLGRRSFRASGASLLCEVVYCLLFGAIYVFVFLNDKDEPTRWKYTAYYTVWEMENLALVVLFLLYGDPAVLYYIPGSKANATEMSTEATRTIVCAPIFTLTDSRNFLFPAVIFHAMTFGLGLAMMGIYYSLLHPSRCPPPSLPLPRHHQGGTTPPPPHPDTNPLNALQTEL